MKKKRTPYKQSANKSPVLQHMCNVAYNPSTPRMILNRLDKLHDDDAAEAAAEAKRARKAAKARLLAERNAKS